MHTCAYQLLHGMIPMKPGYSCMTLFTKLKHDINIVNEVFSLSSVTMLVTTSLLVDTSLQLMPENPSIESSCCNTYLLMAIDTRAHIPTWLSLITDKLQLS
jgi:hypothetical protein